jgi:hypothetical protein
MGVDMTADVGGGTAVASIAGRRLIASFRLSAADAMLRETSRASALDARSSLAALA